MDHLVDPKRIRSSCVGRSSFLKPSKVLNAFSILFENTRRKSAKNEMQLFDQLARNTFRYLRRFSQSQPSFCDKQTLAIRIQKSSFNSLFALINFTLNMKNSCIFVGDAIPLKRARFYSRGNISKFDINIWQQVLYSVFKAAKQYWDNFSNMRVFLFSMQSQHTPVSHATVKLEW